MRRYYRKNDIIVITVDNNERARLRVRGFTAWPVDEMPEDIYRWVKTYKPGSWQMIDINGRTYFTRLLDDFSRAPVAS